MNETHDNPQESDANIPDPEEFDEAGVDETQGLPQPQKISRDFDSSGAARPNESVELDDDMGRNEEEDLTHGDEGIDDPIATADRGAS